MKNAVWSPAVDGPGEDHGPRQGRKLNGEEHQDELPGGEPEGGGRVDTREEDRCLDAIDIEKERGQEATQVRHAEHIAQQAPEVHYAVERRATHGDRAAGVRRHGAE